MRALVGLFPPPNSAIHPLHMIPYLEYNVPMPWEVEYTDEFGLWWQVLSEGQQDAVAARVELLMEHGPNLPYPYSSDIGSSRHGVMRELRAQSSGRAHPGLLRLRPQANVDPAHRRR